MSAIGVDAIVTLGSQLVRDDRVRREALLRRMMQDVQPDQSGQQVMMLHLLGHERLLTDFVVDFR
jgi:hypothetical protein